MEKKFGKRRIVDVSKSDIELFQAQLLKQGLAPKTVSGVLNSVNNACRTFRRVTRVPN
ncbi:hypothetical protein NF679_06565 [Pseudomonas siliginis]|nr:hypothetical protein [Pseudomonas siliginis]UST98057.1 hypothetical protein NF679_06565 [Pseudomonas siliginis]